MIILCWIRLEHEVQDAKAEWKVYAETAKETDAKNRLLDYAGEDKGGMIWENSTETCILQYIK